MAIYLRNIAFVNKILFNSEVWYPLKENDLNPLIKLDESLMRRFLEVNDSTPKESLYLELGIIPVVDIVKCRRIIYLHYLLTLPKDQLLYKFFQAQLRSPSKGDWCELVQKDLKDFNIVDTFDEIEKTKENTFKKKVKKACKIYVFKKLMEIRSQHSKSKEAEYFKLETSKYLMSNMFSVTQSRLLFKLRSRMLQVKMNFKNECNDDINLLREGFKNKKVL